MIFYDVINHLILAAELGPKMSINEWTQPAKTILEPPGEFLANWVMIDNIFFREPLLEQIIDIGEGSRVCIAFLNRDDNHCLQHVHDGFGNYIKKLWFLKGIYKIHNHGI
ncbi:unnamed protein product [Meganyctiphanes norvegica]|uniref:Uncharacterized protein n=1 Tax=Meganyctiphanes norvegica TaxID=48144 RepID=A0AAV2SNF8_MEGNR